MMMAYSGDVTKDMLRRAKTKEHLLIYRAKSTNIAHSASHRIPDRSFPTTAPFSTPCRALQRSCHYKSRVTLAYCLQSGTRVLHEWGEEMSHGLNADLAQPGLEPETS